MQPLTPVYTAHLLLPLHQRLIVLLRGLSASQWEQATAAPGWTVRDVAAHLLDGMLRRLSSDRDGHRSPRLVPEAFDHAGITAFVNELNRGGVAYAERLSRRVLIDLLESAGGALAAYLASQDPDGPALYPVLWAGEDESRVWMDAGREFTEHWHHQAQIREAAGAEPLLGPEWLVPLMDLSVRALPRAYGQVAAADGTAVVLRVDGIGDWSLVRQNEHWQVARGASPDAVATVTVDATTSWKLFYNALKGDAAARAVHLRGDAALARPMLAARAVMV